MIYGRYCRETRRLVAHWLFPSEIIPHAKIEPTCETERSSGLLPDDSAESFDNTSLNKTTAEKFIRLGLSGSGYATTPQGQRPFLGPPVHIGGPLFMRFLSGTVQLGARSRAVILKERTGWRRVIKGYHEKLLGDQAVKRQFVGSALGAALVVLGLSCADAGIITYTATGTVSQASPDLQGQFPVGQAGSYTLTVDTTIPDSDPSASNGRYVNAILFSKGSIGSYDFSTGAGNLTVTNGPTNDNFLTFALATGAAIGSDILKFAIIGLLDQSGVALVNDSIPTSLNLSDFDGLTKINLQFFRPNGTIAEVIIPIATLSSDGSPAPDVPTPQAPQVPQVPLPGTLSLFLAGLGALGLIGWRKKRKRAA